ncbi:MAG: DUF4131 domain-containing protein [Bacteroidetes bacterium]|nr:DUF4131 domain-containing protein [Bacteroidota bacterium]
MYHFWRQNPLLRPALFFLSGIALEESFCGLLPGIILFITCMLALLIPAIFKMRRSVLPALLFFFLGIAFHHTNQADAIEPFEGIVCLKVSSPVRIKEKGLLFTATITETNLTYFKSPAKKQIRVYLKGRYLNPPFGLGDCLLADLSVSGLPQPDNPGAYDYGVYLKRKNVWGQAFLDSGSWNIIAHQHSLFELAETNRNTVLQIIDHHIQSSQDRAMLKALLCGYTEDLDAETRSDFSGSGIMHMLAISGMHMGIILLILQRLFHFIPNRVLRIASLILSLWAFAVFTGMSPSVLRACTMCSLYLLGDLFERRHNAWNAVAFALLVLLTYNTQLLFNAGFQLSFFALGGILLSLPSHSQRPANWMRRFLQQIRLLILISLSAQIATLPVALPLFHSFPLYFLLGNILIVPLAAPIMYLGLALIAFNWVPLLSSGIAFCLDFMLKSCRFLAGVISSLPHSQMDFSHWTPEDSLWYIIFLLGILVIWKLKESHNFIPPILLAIFLLINSVDSLIQRNKKCGLVVFKEKASTWLCYYEQGSAVVYGNNPGSDGFIRIVNPFLQSEGLSHNGQFHPLSENTLITFPKCRIFYATGALPGMLEATEIPSILVLDKNAELDPIFLSDSLNFCNIVLAENLGYWQRQKCLPFLSSDTNKIYDIRSLGAFQIDLWNYSSNMK